MLHRTLSGHLPLQDAIARTIEEAREKMKLAAEDKSDKVKKLVDFEKREHGGKIPSVKEEKEECEKTSSAIDPHNVEEIEKLAAALEYIADEFEKDADSIDNGGEKPQGGQQLPTQSPESGKQSYKKDGSKKHAVPVSTGLQAGDAPQAKTQVPNDHARAPGGTGAKMPANILRKMGGVTMLKAVIEKAAAAKTEKPAVVAPEKAPEAEKAPEVKAEAKPDPVSYIMGKISAAQKTATVENGGEAKQGGEQLANTAPVPSNPGRQLIANNAAPKAATKREAKAPRKAELAQVLTEPAMSAKTDNKVQQNLRNAAKGGVKIAAARAFLAKVASEGCKCDGAGKCQHCVMKAKISSVRETSGTEATA